MKIIRFININGDVRLGTDYDADSALLLHGQLFSKLTITNKREQVKKILAPLNPVNIFCIIEYFTIGL